MKTTLCFPHENVFWTNFKKEAKTVKRRKKNKLEVIRPVEKCDRKGMVQFGKESSAGQCRAGLVRSCRWHCSEMRTHGRELKGPHHPWGRAPLPPPTER